MAARDLFESILALSAQLASLEDAIESAYASAGPHGQQLGSVGGSSTHDSFAGVDSIIDSDAMLRRDRVQARLNERMDYAYDVLHGKSGRGGLARHRYDDALILELRYLQGIGWAEMARYHVEVQGDVADPAEYLRIRARHALRYIDRVGMETLADT